VGGSTLPTAAAGLPQTLRLHLPAGYIDAVVACWARDRGGPMEGLKRGSFQKFRAGWRQVHCVVHCARLGTRHLSAEPTMRRAMPVPPPYPDGFPLIVIAALLLSTSRC
jgi:hypothetical protein